MKLLLDLGNSRLKWALSDADGLRVGTAIAHGIAETAGALDAVWLDLHPQQVVIAAVAADAVLAPVLEVLGRRFPGVPVRRVSSPASACGIVNAYVEPARLGVDRFMAMVAARASIEGAFLVAGCGTALAIDAVDAQGLHQGGLIAPAAELMQRAVRGATAKVEIRDPGRIKALGRSTEDGLLSGCWLAQAALIDRAFDDFSDQCYGPVALLVHGGGAPTVLPLLRRSAELVPDLVLEGLQRFADEHQAGGDSERMLR